MINMSLTVEEEIRLRRLEESVDLLTKRLDELIDGMVSTIKNHPIWKRDEVSNMKNEKKDEAEPLEGALQLFSPEGIEKFFKLCENLKLYVLKVLDSLDQTDHVKDLKNRLKNATVWNEIFDVSILGIAEQLGQLEEKRGVEHGKGH